MTDPQRIEIVLAFAALVVPVLLFLVQRRRRKLTYEITARIPLIQEHDYFAGKVDVLFKGQPVEDLVLIQVLVMNAGNSPVRTADFERSLSIQFGAGAHVLTAEVFETTPDGLNVEIQRHQSSISLPAQLMNPRDKIHVRALVTHASGVAVAGRIAGIRNIERASDTSPILLAVAGSMLTAAGLLFIATPSPDAIGNAPAIVLAVGGYLISALALASIRRWRTMLIGGVRRLFEVRVPRIGRARPDDAGERRESARPAVETRASPTLATLDLSPHDFETALARAKSHAAAEFGSDAEFRYAWTDLLPTLEFNFVGYTTTRIAFGVTVYPDRVATWSKRPEAQPPWSPNDVEAPWRIDGHWRALLEAARRDVAKLQGQFDLEWMPGARSGDDSPWVLQIETIDAEGLELRRLFALNKPNDLVEIGGTIGPPTDRRQAAGT